jgi:hypothetical protein
MGIGAPLGLSACQGMGVTSVTPVQALQAAMVYSALKQIHLCSISPANFQSMPATLKTARTTQANVTFVFEYGSQTPPQCVSGAFGQWSIPPIFPYFLDVSKWRVAFRL